MTSDSNFVATEDLACRSSISSSEDSYPFVYSAVTDCVSKTSVRSICTPSLSILSVVSRLPGRVKPALSCLQGIRLIRKGFYYAA
jgi:hypothetical protein